MSNDKKIKYDLEERTAKFGESKIGFVKKILKSNIADPLINQLVRSATSVGANYCEADCAESKKDFEHKIGICKKESKETKYWLRMIASAIPDLANECRNYWREATELNLFFSAIVTKSRKNRIDSV
jgi:four helix bundle protein